LISDPVDIDDQSGLLPQKLKKQGAQRIRSKIHLVDLAGSERADATGATGQR
jgi:hypothetical protein